MTKCLLCQEEFKSQVSLCNLLWGPKINEPSICPVCHGHLHHRPTGGCPGCGRACDQDLCPDCQQWQNHYGWLLKNRSLYHYDEAMKDFMAQYKFQGDYRLHRVFQDEFTKAVLELNPSLVVPIPATEHTMLTRGFNQAAEL